MFKGLLFAFTLLFSVNAMASDETKSTALATSDPTTLQDCAVDIYTTKSNDIVQQIAKCTEDELSSDSYMSIYVHNMFAELPKFLNLLRDEYEFLFLIAISGIMFLYLVMIMASNKKGMMGKKSNFVMKAALFAFLGTVVLVNGGMQYSISWVIDRLLTNLTLPLTTANNYSLFSRGKSEYLLEDFGGVEAKAKDIAIFLNKSETCALEYQQKQFSNYPFEDKTVYEADESVSCFDTKVEEYSSSKFFDVNGIGRSAGNKSALTCSKTMGRIQTDCGSITISNEYPKLQNVITAYAPKFAQLARDWESFNCKELAETDKEIAETVCKEWNGAEFQLKTTELTLEDLKNATDSLERAFIQNLKNDLVTEVTIETHYKEVNLLNLLSQAWFLVWNDKDQASEAMKSYNSLRAFITSFEIGDLIVNSGVSEWFVETLGGKHGSIDYDKEEVVLKSEELLSAIRLNDIEIRDGLSGAELTNTYESNKDLSVSPRTISDFYYKTHAYVKSEHLKFEYMPSGFSFGAAVFSDPKLLLGDYTNQVDKEDFHLDLWLPKTMKEEYTGMIFTLIGAKLIINKKLKMDQFLGKKPSVLLTKLNSVATFLLILLLVTPFILFYTVLTFFVGSLIHIFTSIIGLFIKAMFVFVTKYKFESLIESLIIILFNIYLPMSLIFTLIFSHVGLVLFLSIIDGSSFFRGMGLAENVLKAIIYAGIAYYVYLHIFFKLNIFFSRLLKKHFQSVGDVRDIDETEAQARLTRDSNKVF